MKTLRYVVVQKIKYQKSQEPFIIFFIINLSNSDDI